MILDPKDGKLKMGMHLVKGHDTPKDNRDEIQRHCDRHIEEFGGPLKNGNLAGYRALFDSRLVDAHGTKLASIEDLADGTFNIIVAPIQKKYKDKMLDLFGETYSAVVRDEGHGLIYTVTPRIVPIGELAEARKESADTPKQLQRDNYIHARKVAGRMHGSFYHFRNQDIREKITGISWMSNPDLVRFMFERDPALLDEGVSDLTGINRRTVTKYRNDAGIPSYNKRMRGR